MKQNKIENKKSKK